MLTHMLMRLEKLITYEHLFKRHDHSTTEWMSLYAMHHNLCRNFFILHDIWRFFSPAK